MRAVVNNNGVDSEIEFKPPRVVIINNARLDDDRIATTKSSDDFMIRKETKSHFSYKSNSTPLSL